MIVKTAQDLHDILVETNNRRHTRKALRLPLIDGKCHHYVNWGDAEATTALEEIFPNSRLIYSSNDSFANRFKVN